MAFVFLNVLQKVLIFWKIRVEMGGWGGGGFSFSTFRKRKEETHIVIVTNGKDCITYS